MGIAVQALFGKAPIEAIDWLKQRQPKSTFDYHEVLDEEHYRSFVIAQMADLGLLNDVKQSLIDALAQNLDFKTWQQNILPTLQQKGWWGERFITDSQGSTRQVTLGTPQRLKTIFYTNIQNAYERGREARALATAKATGQTMYVLYSAILDGRTRPSHRALNGHVFRVDDPAWQAIKPKNGYNCRCTAIYMSREEAERFGYTIVDDLSEFVSTEPVLVGLKSGNPRLTNITVVNLPDGTVFKTDVGFGAQLKVPEQQLLNAANKVDAELAAKHLSYMFVHHANFVERLNSEVKAWIQGVNVARPNAEMRYVGVLPPEVLAAIAQKGAQPASAIVAIHDRLTLGHIAREHKNHDPAWFENIVNHLAGGYEVYWDNLSNNPVLIFDAPDGNTDYKLVLVLDYFTKARLQDGSKEQVTTNLIRTLVIEQKGNVTHGKNYSFLVKK